MFTADFALKRFFACVKIFVLYGVGTDREGLVADLAFVFGGAFVSPDVHFEMISGCVPVGAQVAVVFAVFAVAYRM